MKYIHQYKNTLETYGFNKREIKTLAKFFVEKQIPQDNIEVLDVVQYGPFNHDIVMKFEHRQVMHNYKPHTIRLNNYKVVA